MQRNVNVHFMFNFSVHGEFIAADYYYYYFYYYYYPNALGIQTESYLKVKLTKWADKFNIGSCLV